MATVFRNNIANRKLSLTQHLRTRTWALLSLAFLSCGLARSCPGQKWFEDDGFRIGLHFEACAEPQTKFLDLHRTIVVHGENIEKDWQTATLSFLGKAGGAHKVRGKFLADFRGHKALEYALPLLDVGEYTLVFELKEKKTTLAAIKIPAFRCYFNQPGDPRQARSLADVVPALNLPTVMVRYIDRAKKTVDIAMSDFDHPEFVAAVIRAQKRGIRVRFISDERAHDREPVARKRLSRAKVPFITNGRDLKDSTTMHHKFTILDDKIVLVGHAKGNIAHTHVNQSFVAVIGPELARIYLDEFNEMWGGAGLESPAEKRRFNMAKLRPKHHHCEVATLYGKTRVDVAFGPAREPSGEPLSRPINMMVAALAGRAQTDILFLASGFGDTDVGKVIRQAMNERGVKFYGVQGDPDWHMTYNKLVEEFRGEGKNGWSPPADVVGTYEMAPSGKWVNVHNRIIVFDVLGPALAPVACFSSGAWRMGLQKADDSMVCIHDRRVSEQLLQHIGGTRMRSQRPLPPRHASPKLSVEGAAIKLPIREILPLLGGRIESNFKGGIALVLDGVSLCWGERSGLNLPAIQLECEQSPAAKELSLNQLSSLGIFLEEREGKTYCRSLNSAGFPVDLAKGAPTSAIKKVRQGEDFGPGIVAVEANYLGKPTADLHGGIARKNGFAVVETNGLAVLTSSLPHFQIAENDKQPILVEPQVAIALDQAIRAWQSKHAGSAALEVVDGSGMIDTFARQVGRENWRFRRGAGLVIRLPSGDSKGGEKRAVRDLIEALRAQMITRINIDRSLLGDSVPLEFLLDGKPGSWTREKRPGLFASKDRKTFISIGKIGHRLMELEQAIWDFRGFDKGDAR